MTIIARGSRVLEVFSVFLERLVGSKKGRLDASAVGADELRGRIDVAGLEDVDGHDQRPKALFEVGDDVLVGGHSRP